MNRAAAFLKSKRVGYAAILLLAVIVAYFLFVRGIRNFLVPSSSMEPTLLVGDHMVTLKEDLYRRGDIVVARDGAPGEYIVKRIAAVGGDTLLIIDGALYIDGAYVSEPYIKEPMRYLVRDPLTVPAGHVFLLGDNRNNSDDSAMDGRSHPLTDIVGRVRLIYFPYGRFGPVPRFPLTAMIEASAPVP